MSNIQKPVLQVGDAVFSAWWPDIERNEPATWHPGIITNVKVDHSKNFGYGPLRLYDIGFDDGDMLNKVWDVFVFPRDEYFLNTSEQMTWRGIENVTDEQSKDDWARIVGWYVVSIDGHAPKTFPLLSEALKACNSSAVLPENQALSSTVAESNSCRSQWSPPAKKSAKFTCVSYKTSITEFNAKIGCGEFLTQQTRFDPRRNRSAKISDILDTSSSDEAEFVTDAVQDSSGTETDALSALSDVTNQTAFFSSAAGLHKNCATCKNAELYASIPLTKSYGSKNDEAFAFSATCNEDVGE
ncbi:hypothetical protein ACHAW6_010247 [Cyclotella cf. meneghiniana]